MGNHFQGIVKNQFLELERSTDEGLPMGKILAIPTIVWTDPNPNKSQEDIELQTPHKRIYTLNSGSKWW